VESAGDFAAKGSADTWNRTEAAPNTAQRRAASSGEFQQSAGGSLAEGIEFEERPLFTRTRILLGVVALVLVGAVIAMLFHPTTGAKRAIPIPPPAAVETTGGAGTGAEVGTSVGTSAGTSTGTPAEPETKKAEEPVTPPPPVKKTVVVSQKTPPKTTAKNKKDAVEAPPEVDASLSEFGGLTQKDIPRLLDNAKRDAGDGNYDKARREYQAILKLQANNPDAKEGLRKLSIIQGDKDQ
jgi:hypothetical protein